MILYKYMKAEHAISTLTNKTIMLAKAPTFNDPFEFNACLTIDPDDPQRYLATLEHQIKPQVEDDSYLYCMTRNPLNLLMWAHYGDEHKGVVLGFEIEDDFFTNTDKCIVPIQYGNVIYSHTKPSHEYNFPTPEYKKPIFTKFDSNYLEGLQRFFLYKSAHWAYEEEVRLVKFKKVLQTENRCQKVENSFSRVKITLPQLRITEIFLGCRFEENKENFKEKITQLAGDTKIQLCRTSSRNWGLETGPYIGL